MSTMRRPTVLREGDAIALISPASPFARDQRTPGEVLNDVAARFQSVGLRTVVSRHAKATYGYLAGEDEARASDLMAAFADPEIDAILCTCGGYGTPRLLDRLDYGLIARNPKVFIGYSDITAIHLAIGRRAGLVTFHGPMGFELSRTRDTVGGGVGLAECPDFSWNGLLRAVMSTEPLGELLAQAPWQDEPLKCIVPGQARGALVGGNLSLLSATLGTPYEIDTKGKIVLIEEVGEAPYRIDRMLTQLRLAGKLQEAAGFIFGEWTDCDPPNPSRPSLTLRQVLADIVEPLGRPTVCGLAAGHGPGRLTLPLGVTVSINASLDPHRCRIVVEESGVAEAASG